MRRLQLRTVHDLDHRSRAYRRAKAVVRELTEAMGGTVTPMQRQTLERAGMLSAIAEDLQAGIKRGRLLP
jgi:hypothetical protein